MLKSGRPTADELRSAITDALTAGVVTRDEILDMVSTDSPDIGSNGHALAEPMSGADDLPIYTELPEGLIDLPSAITIYDGVRPRLRNWVKRGYLAIHGRLRAPAPGGGYVIVSKPELMEKLVTGERSAGRPRKN